jgi:hypothetical protein
MEELKAKPQPKPNPFWVVVSSWPVVIVSSILVGLLFTWGSEIIYAVGAPTYLDTVDAIKEELSWLPVFGHNALFRSETTVDIIADTRLYVTGVIFFLTFVAGPIAASLLIIRDVIKQRRLSQANVKAIVFIILLYVMAAIAMPNY